MKKAVTINLDIDVAKLMLEVEGFNINNKTDDEIFDLVMERISIFGATAEEYKKEDY